jgi:hypothetical protein
MKGRKDSEQANVDDKRNQSALDRDQRRDDLR